MLSPEVSSKFSLHCVRFVGEIAAVLAIEKVIAV